MSTLSPIEEVWLPTGDCLPIHRRRFGGTRAGPRLYLAAGIRGDAPEGVRVAHRVAAFLEEVEAQIQGTIDLVPCANPLAVERGTRRWPFFDLDLNRRFPGRADGHPPDRVAHSLVADAMGADLVVELRGARPGFHEAPQAHVRERSDRSAELAMSANVQVVWCRHPGPAAPATFAHQFPTAIVLEGGIGNQLTPGVGAVLRDGVLGLAAALGLLPESVLPFALSALRRPARVGDEEVFLVRAEASGLFLPEIEVGATVDEGALLGLVVDPISGALREELRSPSAGWVLAMRQQPVVYPGSPVARVVAGEVSR